MPVTPDLDLADIVLSLRAVIGRKHNVQLVPVLSFLLCASSLRDDIALAQHAHQPNEQAPPYLPRSIRKFLADACDIPCALISVYWTVLKDIAWDESAVSALRPNIPFQFEKHGKHVGLSPVTFYPPVERCTTRGCQRTTLLKQAQFRLCAYFTHQRGVMRAYDVTLTCPRCKSGYHHNYVVHAGVRRYYGGIPEALEVAEHQYAETRLARHWRNEMATSAKSATHCAEIYNDDYSRPPDAPHEAPHIPLSKGGPSLGIVRTHHILDAFCIISLLESLHNRLGDPLMLSVPNTGDQSDRFTEAMRSRNTYIRANGLKHVMHHCDWCTRFYDHQDTGDGVKRVSVLVMDGVTLGYYCCSSYNCKNELPTQRHCFCKDHEQLNHVCAVRGCGQQVVAGTKTCAMPAHQQVERIHNERGQASFQLRERLRRTRLAAATQARDGGPRGWPTDDVVLLDAERENEVLEFEVGEDGQVLEHEPLLRDVLPSDADGAQLSELPLNVGAAQPTRRITAQFTRACTHNKQLVVAPCGVIIARDTFYGAEGLASCAEFIQRIFCGRYKPSFLYYDSNCGFSQHVEGLYDGWFDDIGLPVDVFHFKCKHKESDEYCQQNCNPALFPELLNNNGEWEFNSSIAKQTNVYIAGFAAIVREMTPAMFNFFLDEMILCRNEKVVARLQKAGARPTF